MGAVSLLKPFAVLAFAMAIPRLPGHVAAGSSVDTASAHSSPFRLTTAAHIALPWFSPPASPFCAGAFCNRVFRLAAAGTSSQPRDRGGVGEDCGRDSSRAVGVAWPQAAARTTSRAQGLSRAAVRVDAVVWRARTGEYLVSPAMCVSVSFCEPVSASNTPLDRLSIGTVIRLCCRPH